MSFIGKVCYSENLNIHLQGDIHILNNFVRQSFNLQDFDYHNGFIGILVLIVMDVKIFVSM